MALACAGDWLPACLLCTLLSPGLTSGNRLGGLDTYIMNLPLPQFASILCKMLVALGCKQL